MLPSEDSPGVKRRFTTKGDVSPRPQTWRQQTHCRIDLGVLSNGISFNSHDPPVTDHTSPAGVVPAFARDKDVAENNEGSGNDGM